MRLVTRGFLSLLLIGSSLALVPIGVTFGLLILSTAPNPRHPPGDLTGEAFGWAIIGVLFGATSAIIGESVTMREARGFFIENRGLIIGGTVGVIIATFLGVNLAVLQMDSVDGQAITSVNLGILAGATVSILGAIGGVVVGAVLRRLVIAMFQ